MMSPSLNILMANWTWYRFAGDWTYIDNLKKLYGRYGHNVIPFSMKSPMNEDANGFEQYFVDFIDYKELNRNKTIANGVKAVSKSIWSGEAKRNLIRLLDHQRVDIAHIHNIHHYISPSILPVLKDRKIPIIWTLHDYTLLCPENSFLSNDRICENCKGGQFYHCAMQRCKKKSLLASSLAAFENYVHRYMNVFRHVDYFLCPSEFMYKKFQQFNFFPEKLVLSNLCFELENLITRNEREDYILFVGRLSKPKGIMTLLKAVEGTTVKLCIAGDGDQRDSIMSYIDAHNMKNVSLLGYKTKDEVHELISKAMLVVCPSEGYEIFPFSVIESLSLKTPVVASAIGGIPELVVHEQTGLLFEPGNFLELRKCILRLVNDPELLNALGARAFDHVNSIVNYQQHYGVLKKVYENIGLQL